MSDERYGVSSCEVKVSLTFPMMFTDCLTLLKSPDHSKQRVHSFNHSKAKCKNGTVIESEILRQFHRHILTHSTRQNLALLYFYRVSFRKKYCRNCYVRQHTLNLAFFLRLREIEEKSDKK